MGFYGIFDTFLGTRSRKWDFRGGMKELENLAERDNEAEIKKEHGGKIWRWLGENQRSLTNFKNWQIWNFGLEEVKLGIGSSMKEYAEWYYGGDSEISRETELNQGRYGWKIDLFIYILFF